MERSWRISLAALAVLGAASLALPAASLAEPAEDEYQLDIPRPGNGDPEADRGSGDYPTGDPPSYPVAGDYAGDGAGGGSEDLGASSGGADSEIGAGSALDAGAGSALADVLSDAGEDSEGDEGGNSAFAATADVFTDGGMPLLLLALVAIAVGAALLARRRAARR